jgi:hypothetical protein
VLAVTSNSQVTTPPAVTAFGEQTNEETALPDGCDAGVPLTLLVLTLPVRVTEVLATLPFSEAVMVAVCLLLDEPASALKLDVAAPAETETDAGTVRELLLLASVTLDPPAGAVRARVTLQVLLVSRARLVGLQATPETITDANRLIVAVWELLPRVAVTVAV